MEDTSAPAPDVVGQPEGPIKNIAIAHPLVLKDQVDYAPAQIVSKTLVQNDQVSITLFSFDAGQQIASHIAGGDAFATVLEGQGSITIDDAQYFVSEGQSLIMPLGHPHAVCAVTNFKMLFVVVYPSK